MGTDSLRLTTLTVLAAAAEQLARGGYTVVREQLHPGLPPDKSLLAEDSYGVVAVSAYENWADLEVDWANAQGALVEILSRRLTRADPKAWDGYLVLFCTAPAQPPDAGREIE